MRTYMRLPGEPYQRPSREGWYLDYRLNGKRERLCFPTQELAWKHWREVKRFKLQARASQMLDRSPAKKDALIPVFIEEFLAFKEREITAESIQTYRAYGGSFMRFLKECHPEIQYVSQVTHKSVDDFVTWLKESREASEDKKVPAYGLGYSIKQETQNRYLFFVKSLLYKAVDWEYLDANPALRVRKLAVTDARPPRMISREELAAVIQKAEEPYRTLFLAYVGTGLRKTALLNVKWEDIDFRNGVIRSWSLPGRRTKTRKSQAVPIPSWLAPILQRNLARDDEYPFRRPGGRLYQNNELCQRLRGAAKRAKVKGWTNLRLHDLRHTYGRWLVEEGTDVRVVQELLGHSSVETTFLYTKPSRSFLHQVVERLPNPLAEGVAVGS